MVQGREHGEGMLCEWQAHAAQDAAGGKPGREGHALEWPAACCPGGAPRPASRQHTGPCSPLAGQRTSCWGMYCVGSPTGRMLHFSGA